MSMWGLSKYFKPQLLAAVTAKDAYFRQSPRNFHSSAVGCELFRAFHAKPRSSLISSYSRSSKVPFRVAELLRINRPNIHISPSSIHLQIPNRRQNAGHYTLLETSAAGCNSQPGIFYLWLCFHRE